MLFNPVSKTSGCSADVATSTVQVYQIPFLVGWQMQRGTTKNDEEEQEQEEAWPVHVHQCHVELHVFSLSSSNSSLI